MKEKRRKKEEIGEGIEELLTRLRKENGWTYADILMKLPDKTLTEKDIKKWEIGLKYPDLDMIYELSALYQVSAAEFIQAKSNSFEKGLASVHITIAKWICYFLNVSIHAGIVLMVIFYVFMFIFSLWFFVTMLSTVDKSRI